MKQSRKVFEIKKRIFGYIKENQLISKGDHVIVGLSGGADSVCLLVLLHDLKDELGFTMSAIHLHHGIRGESADRDADFARKMCENLDIPIDIEYRNIPGEAEKTGESIEECARRIRYEIFAEKCTQYVNGVIAVAHHLDDQAETILFRMIRGTGIKGLKAMRPKNGNIIRPLLCMGRDEIITFLNEEKISYCFDESNDDTAYSRNRIRHLMMPEAKKMCPEASLHFAEIADEAAKIDEYLDKKAHELYIDALITDEAALKIMNIDKLIMAEDIIRQRAIKEMIGSMIHSLKDITREHVESIERLLSQDKSSSVNLPKNLRVIKERNTLTFTIEKEKECTSNICIKVDAPGKYMLPDKREVIVSSVIEEMKGDIPRNLYTKWFDYDKIIPGLCIRTRREGDYLVTDAHGSHKSISRYMIDEKIPKSQRDKIYLLAAGSEVYWVIGYRISESIKITDKTKRIIKIEIKGEDNE